MASNVNKQIFKMFNAKISKFFINSNSINKNGIVKRDFWAWLNIMFNLVDQARIKEVGPDRACAEWIMRNGGKVTFQGEESTSNFNAYAALGKGVYRNLVEVDASEISIIERGFDHFKGCNHLRSLKFHKNAYLTDGALDKLNYVSNSLKRLQISSCEQVTDRGILSLTQLRNLTDLTLLDLQGVKDWKNCESKLRQNLPGAKFEIV